MYVPKQDVFPFARNWNLTELLAIRVLRYQKLFHYVCTTIVYIKGREGRHVFFKVRFHNLRFQFYGLIQSLKLALYSHYILPDTNI
jgi:hypothetical protein